jgi:hypothetical protein
MEQFKQRERILLSDLSREFPNAGFEFPDLEWVFWCSPTQQIWDDLGALSDVMKRGETMTIDEYRDAEDRFMSAVSEIVISTGETKDIDGNPLDLSTPEAARRAFDGEINIDQELLGGVIMDYIAHLKNRRVNAKKKSAETSTSTNTGSANGKQAVPSPT